jgi:hypothetical protein
LAAVAGASVEFDPRSTDFAKIRLGNTRIDPWFGLQPWVRAFVQFGLGQTKSTRTGKIRELGDPSVFKGDTRLDVAGRFIRGKFSPGVNLALDVARGRPAFGNEPLEFFKDEFPYLGDDTLEQITPLVIQDIREAWEQGETDHLALTIGTAMRAWLKTVPTWALIGLILILAPVAGYAFNAHLAADVQQSADIRSLAK